MYIIVIHEWGVMRSETETYKSHCARFIVALHSYIYILFYYNASLWARGPEINTGFRPRRIREIIKKKTVIDVSMG